MYPVEVEEYLKIYEALAEVKTLDARLVQLSKFRESSLVHDADVEPDFKYEEISGQIDAAMARETELKLVIQEANLSNTITVGERQMSLARAILELSNVRAKLGYISGMLAVEKRSGLFGLGRRSKDEVPQKWQKTPAALLQMETEYQAQKNTLDAAIQEANHRFSIAV